MAEQTPQPQPVVVQAPWRLTDVVILVAVGWLVVQQLQQGRDPDDTPGPSPSALETLLRSQLDPALSGDSALYYAGVFESLAGEIESGEIQSFASLTEFITRVAEAADRGEPQPVQIKAPLLDAFREWDKQNGEIGSNRTAVAQRARLLSRICEESRG